MVPKTRNIALYGGSFDPVHRGHLNVARAAAASFGLERIYFVPADVQPLKSTQKVTHYYHRYAMLALALAGESGLVPSLLEAPEIVRASGAKASYTVETVARMQARLGEDTRLFFLMGMDAFEHIRKWHEAERLLRSAEFIVANRPGYALENIVRALPESMHPDAAAVNAMRESGTLRTSGAVIHLLPGVHEDVSATEIREAAGRGDGLEELVPAAVADYILKLKIYDEAEEAGAPEPPRP